MTASELNALHAALGAVRDELQACPVWCEDSPLGLLCEVDDDAIAAAARVIHRMYLNARFSSTRSATDYLTPTPEPQSLRA
jgi:hypothetical protein